MKIEIKSLEDYNEAKKRYEEIEQEQKYLEDLVKGNENNTVNYNAHVPLGLNFEELVINLQRDNTNINGYLNEVICNFLKSQNIPKKKKNHLKDIFLEQVNKLSEIPIDKTPQISSELNKITEDFPDFQNLYSTIIETSKRKQTNDYLINYMNNLGLEADALSAAMFKYEKENRKKERASAFRSIFSSKSKDSNKKSRR